MIISVSCYRVILRWWFRKTA